MTARADRAYRELAEQRERVEPTCGKCGGLVDEVSLMPRAVYVASIDDKGSIEYGDDRMYPDAEDVLGYGCDDYRCPNWLGTIGTGIVNDDGSITYGRGPTLAEVTGR